MLNHNIRQDLLEKDYNYRRLHGIHQKLEHEIEDLQKHPSADAAYMKALKLQKLKLRESMHQIEETVH